MLDQEQELRFAKARRGAIAREFAHLNPEQQRAVLATEGPLLLLARGWQWKDHRAHPPHRQPDEIRPGLRQPGGAGAGDGG